jgi:putative ABC transport system permease protein
VFNHLRFSVFTSVLVTIGFVCPASRGDDSPLRENPSPYGFDLIVGSRGSALQLTLSTIYHVGNSSGNVPFALYEDMLSPTRYRSNVKIAVPYVVGDTYKGKDPIVGTSGALFGVGNDGRKLDADRVMEYQPGKRYELESGKPFGAEKFEAVVGSDLANLADLRIGSTLQATHGKPPAGEAPDIHPEVWTVVGVLKPTGTSSDRVVFIPFKSCYAIEEHAAGMKAHWYIRNKLPPPPANNPDDKVPVYTMNPDGTFNLLVPQEMWELSAILIKARSGFGAESLIYTINSGNEAMAVKPESTARELAKLFRDWLPLGVIPAEEMNASTGGVSIAATITDSPAAAAGLKAGDVLVEFDNQRLSNCLDLAAALAKAHSGDNAQLRIRRGSDTFTLQITLAAPGLVSVRQK